MDSKNPSTYSGPALRYSASPFLNFSLPVETKYLINLRGLVNPKYVIEPGQQPLSVSLPTYSGGWFSFIDVNIIALATQRSREHIGTAPSGIVSEL